MLLRTFLFTLIVGMAPIVALGSPFDNLKNIAEKAVIDTVKNSTPASQPARTASGIQQVSQTSGQSNTSPSDMQNSIDGSWYSEDSGIGVEIQNGKGIATASNKSGHKIGDLILEISSSDNDKYRGRMLTEVRRSQLGWLDFKAAIYGNKLRIGTSDRSEYIFSKGNPPKLSDVYPSGIRYIVGSCAPGTFGVALIDSAKVNFRKLPSGGQYKFEEAPSPLSMIFTEANEFMRNACGDGAIRGQYPIFFQSSPLPALPLKISDFDNADAKSYINAGTASLSNRRALEVIQEQKEATQRTAQQAAVARATEATARKANFLKKFGAVELQEMGILWSNPFSLEGKTVAITVDFYQMTTPTEGHFEVLTHSLRDRGGDAVISDIPKGVFLQPVRAFLAAKVIGLKPVVGIAGGEPHLNYIGAVICKSDDSWCP